MDETALDGNGKTPADLLPQDGADGIRRLLARAPADRVWRRRGWLVMLRLRASKADDEETRPTQRLLGTVVCEAKDQRAKQAAVAHKLLGVQEDGVFRTLVRFL